MATTIGDLAVRVGADTTGLIKGLNDSSTKIDQFGSKVRSSSNDLAKYGLAAAAAGIAIGTVLVKQQLKAIDSLAKTSDKLGIATEKLGGLRHAAELTGAGAETLDKGLRQMARGVSEAADGTGLAKDAIDKLGLSATKLRSLSPDQQFSEIADAMNKVTNSSDRLSIASDIFGGRGTALINTLALGSKGLADMQAEADALGISLTRVQAAKVEAANDALTRAGAAMEGVAKRATVDLAPLIEALANEFVNVAKETDNFGASAVSAVKTIVTPIGVLLDGIRGIQVAIKAVEVLFKGLAYGAVADFNLIVRGWTELANLLPGIDVDFNDTFLGKLESSAKDSVAGATAELHKLAMETIPSEQIDNYISKIDAAATAAGKAVADQRKLMIDGDGGASGGGLTDAQKQKEQNEKDAAKRRLQAVRDQFASEAELLAQQVEADHLVLVESLDRELITNKEYNALELDLKSKHESDLTDLEQQAADARLKIAEAEAQAKRQAMSQMFTDLSSLMNSGSRKMFEIGKAAAITQTILSTYEGAQKAFTALAGIPYVGPALGAAAAGAAIASGMARVQAINSTSFGSKSAPSAGGGVAGGGSASGAPTSAEGGAGGSSRVINIQGLSMDGLVDGAMVRKLILAINEGQEDGSSIIRFD